MFTGDGPDVRCEVCQNLTARREIRQVDKASRMLVCQTCIDEDRSPDPTGEIDRLCRALYFATSNMLHLKLGETQSPERIIRSAKDYAEMVGATWPEDFEPPKRTGDPQDG